MFFVAFSSSRVSICFALLHRQAYTFSSQRACGFLLGLSGTLRPPTTSWLWSMFSLLPPEWGGVWRECEGIIFWCPDVGSPGFPNLWTRSREQACRVEAYNLPDLLLIYSLKQWGQSMLILTLVINTLLLPTTLHKSVLGHKCDWCYFVFFCMMSLIKYSVFVFLFFNVFLHYY